MISQCHLAGSGNRITACPNDLLSAFFCDILHLYGLSNAVEWHSLLLKTIHYGHFFWG